HSMPGISPGSDGEPLPAGTRIFRIARGVHLSPETIRQQVVTESMFQPSSSDLRLSVWVEELTIADQAWTFLNENPKNNIVLCLSTELVRAIPPEQGFAAMDVEWELATKVVNS